MNLHDCGGRQRTHDAALVRSSMGRAALPLYAKVLSDE
jgi:hypothetical protein